MNSLKKCNNSHHKSYKDVPSPYFSTSHMTEGVCDPLKQPRLDAFPISTFTPSNLHEFESNLTGWTDFIDHHHVPGFIINNFATNVTLSFPLNYVDISELEGEILKVMYLKTYYNAGRFQVYICGKKLKGMLDTHHDFRVSVPAVYTEQLRAYRYDGCRTVLLS